MSRLLICTMGIPRSGKSTWARKQSWPTVEPDSIRLAMHGKIFYGPMEPWILAVAFTMVESLFLSGHNTVIFDSCAMTKKKRNALRDWHSWNCKFKFFNTDLDVCIKRAKEQINPDLQHVVLRMFKNFEPLGLEEQIYL